MEGKKISMKANLPPQTLNFIDPLLKILDLDILNPLSTLGYRNGGIVLDIERMLLLLPYQNFSPSNFVGLVVWP